MAGKEPSLYETLGKEAGIGVIVEDFYSKVLVSPILKDFFKNTNMTKQKQMQTKFITQLTGGPKYNGKSMRAAHAKLSLKDEHFDEVLKLLGEAFLRHGVSEASVTIIAQEAEKLRGEVLGN